MEESQQQSDTQMLINHYLKLMQYKNNLFKLDTLIQLEKDPSTHEELVAMRGDLLQAISYQEDVVKFTQNTDDYYFNVERITSGAVGRVAKAYYTKQARWFNIEILNVDVETQMCDVFFIGMKEKVELSSIFVKLLPAFSPTIFQAGTYCEAIYSEDGNFYACVIEKVEGDEFHIRFKKYNKRESKNADYNKKIQFENLDTFKVPDYLKILPNDTEEQRQKKKKKIKALKQQFRNAQYEKDNQDKQSHWSVFRDQAIKQNKGYFKNTKESIFKSPETIMGRVGVVNSGRGLTQQKTENNNPLKQVKQYDGKNKHLYKMN